MDIEALRNIRAELPEGCRLVAVSKFHPAEAVMEAYEAGQRVFGESHVQELMQKEAAMPKDIEWHFIGHLQTNKVKYIAPYVALIHAVDSIKLLREIDKQGAKADRRIPVLLEMHIAQEESKYGFEPDELMQMLSDGEWRELQHVSIRGLMMMASYVDDEQQITAEFKQAHEVYAEVKQRFFADDAAFCELSMGMSHDYRLAIAEGSTMVRVGTKIFGNRTYI